MVKPLLQMCICCPYPPRAGALQYSTTKLVKEVCDEGDQVQILFGDFVEVPEVYTKSQATILFLGKEDWGTGW